MKLMILDCMALAHRCWWAHKELMSSKGEYTGTAYGAATFIRNLILSQKPTHFVAVTDIKGKTFRHDMYPEYKANRSAHTEEFYRSLGPFFKLIESLGVKVMSAEGFEADDVIGSICKKFPEVDKYIVSGDKDFMQLVDKTTFLYRPGKYPDFEILDEAGVEAKVGLKPCQIIDYLALMGDSSDNVPGVAGIGAKGAEKLLKSYGSIGNIYGNINNLQTTKKALNGLIAGYNDAVLSQKLVTIVTDAPVQLDLSEVKVDWTNLATEPLINFYKEMEFNSLLNA